MRQIRRQPSAWSCCVSSTWWTRRMPTIASTAPGKASTSYRPASGSADAPMAPRSSPRTTATSSFLTPRRAPGRSGFTSPRTRTVSAHNSHLVPVCPSVRSDVQPREAATAHAQARHQAGVGEDETHDRLLGRLRRDARVGNDREQRDRAVDPRRPALARLEPRERIWGHEEDEYCLGLGPGEKSNRSLGHTPIADALPALAQDTSPPRTADDEPSGHDRGKNEYALRARYQLP